MRRSTAPEVILHQQKRAEFATETGFLIRIMALGNRGLPRGIGTVKKLLVVLLLCGFAAPAQAQCVEAAGLAEHLAKTRLRDKAGQEKLARVAKNIPNLIEVHAKLVAASDAKPGLAVCPSWEINAVVVEGGKHVYVYAGLVERYGHEPGHLAAVLAHEIGHISRRHFEYRRNARDYFVSQAKSAGYGEFYRSGDAKKARTAAAGALVAKQAAFSREQEADADSFGTVLLGRAGFDPQAMSAMMTRFLLDKPGDAATSWFSTHPGWAERLERVEPRIYDEEADRLVRAMQVSGERRALARQINGWLEQLPDSGNAWFHKAAFLERVRSLTYLEAYERALTAQSPPISRTDPDVQALWLRLCIGLHHAGHKLESVYCSQSIRAPELRAAYRDATFGEALFVHGDPSPESSLVTARDADGSRIITNDPNVLRNRGLTLTHRIAPWRPVRFPPAGADAALRER